MNKINNFEKTEFDHIFLIKQATFVSLLLRKETVLKCGLPIKDFFIWGDDIEYTRRISIKKNIPSYYIDNSVAFHKTENNVGSKIAFDKIDKMNRYYYAYRNECYLYRSEGIKGVIYFTLKCIYNYLRIIFLSKNNKIKRIETLNKGIKDGVCFNPEVENL